MTSYMDEIHEKIVKKIKRLSIVRDYLMQLCISSGVLTIATAVLSSFLAVFLGDTARHEPAYLATVSLLIPLCALYLVVVFAATAANARIKSLSVKRKLFQPPTLYDRHEIKYVDSSGNVSYGIEYRKRDNG